MQVLITVTPSKGAKTASVTGKRSSTDLKVELVEDNRLIFLADPVSWSVVAIAVFEKFASSFAQAAGKELGTAFGKWLAERLGFGSGSDKAQVKALLDAFAKQVIEAIRQQFVEQQFRVAHEGLAATSRQLEGFLIAPKSETLTGLTNLDLEVSRVYEQLKNLGPGALPSLCRAGVMLIVIAVRLYGKTGDKGQAKIALGRIDEVLKDVKDRIQQIEAIYKGRVFGPYETTYKAYCEVNDPDITVVPGAKAPLGRWWHEVHPPAFGVTVDGSQTTFPRKSNPCNKKLDWNEKAFSEASAYARASLLPIEAEFQNDFLAPALAVEAKAAEVKAKLGGKA